MVQRKVKVECGESWLNSDKDSTAVALTSPSPRRKAARHSVELAPARGPSLRLQRSPVRRLVVRFAAAMCSAANNGSEALSHTLVAISSERIFARDSDCSKLHQ